MVFARVIHYRRYRPFLHYAVPMAILQNKRSRVPVLTGAFGATKSIAPIASVRDTRSAITSRESRASGKGGLLVLAVNARYKRRLVCNPCEKNKLKEDTSKKTVSRCSLFPSFRNRSVSKERLFSIRRRSGSSSSRRSSSADCGLNQLLGSSVCVLFLAEA